MRKSKLSIHSPLPPSYAQDEQATIDAALAILAKRINKGNALTEPGMAMDYCRLQLAGREHEVFAVVWLDSRHRVIAFDEMFRGTVDSSEVHPREIVKAALARNAAACFITHNHPSGSLEFSPADRAVTARLKQALTLIDVRVLDHILVTVQGTASLARLGGL